jgi:hypothetical protein
VSPTSFNTENRTYRQVLGNGLTYQIPRFQRDYSWGEEEWEDLWVDILGALPADGEPAHYMGYLVLQTANQREFSVIDGQQRLTTVSLIVLAAMRILQRLSRTAAGNGPNQQRLQQLRATYIGYLDPVTLTTRNKLSLNRNNDSYYRDYLVPLADHLPQRGFPASTHAMRKAFEWFECRLQQQIRTASDPGMPMPPMPTSGQPWPPAPSPPPANWPSALTAGPPKPWLPARRRWQGPPPAFGA